MIENLLKQYQNSPLKKKDILREILQQCALLGLARHDFFEHAAFYGGTALRILYGLDRFSEDLDFSLLKKNSSFNFQPFLNALQKEMSSFGFIVDAQTKSKTQDSAILSAFLKSNTQQLLLTINEKSSGIHREEKITIKIEIDIDPPPLFNVESKLVLQPTPFYVQSYVPEDLFAGKMHAMLFRSWGNRVKGRDWYDFIWFLKNGIALNLSHLEARMQQSGHLSQDERLNDFILKEMLKERIAALNWKQAVDDVKPFLQDAAQLQLWSSQFFNDLSSQIKMI